MRWSHNLPAEGVARTDTDVDRAHDAFVLKHFSGEAGIRIKANAQLRDVETVSVTEGFQMLT